MIPLEDFWAYYACRKNKRRTVNALSFETNYEENLVNLCEEVNNKWYQFFKSSNNYSKEEIIRNNILTYF